MHSPLIPAPVTQDFLEQHAALDLRGDVAVIGHQHIAFLHRQADTRADRFLSFTRRVGTQLAGALQVDRGKIE